MQYVQLKNAMLRNDYLRDKIKTEWNLKYNFTLPASIPTSLIAKDFESEADETVDIEVLCLQALSAMFDKYILLDCALEVNISSQVRLALANMFKEDSLDADIENIFVYMEKAVIQISKLMHDSFLRFKNFLLDDEV